MKNGQYLVMRYATLIGRADGRRIVSVASRHRRLVTALHAVGTCGPGSYWVVEAGKPAHRKKAPVAERET